MNDLTVCLMTCGEVTEPDCLEAIRSWTHCEPWHRPFTFQEVRGLTPASTALNQMFSQCQTQYLVPLDADMIVYPTFLSRVENALKNASEDDKWHTILFPLWDTLTLEKIYALKVFNMKAMRSIPYKDDPCPDIQHYKDMTSAGLHSIDLFHEDPIGDHVVKGNFYCYAKYRDLYLTARSRPRDILESHFKGGKTLREKAMLHHAFFMGRYESTKNEDYLYCIGGMLEGLKAPLTYTSKDLSERWMMYPNDQSEQFLEWYEHDKKHRVFV